MITNRCKKSTWQIQIYHTRRDSWVIFCLRVAEKASSARSPPTRVCSQQGVACVIQCTTLTHSSHPPTPRLLGSATGAIDPTPVTKTNNSELAHKSTICSLASAPHIRSLGKFQSGCGREKWDATSVVGPGLNFI